MVVIKDQTQLSSEIAHIQSVLQLNGYPERFSQTSNTRKQATSINNVKRKGFVSLPFVDGTTQAIRRILTRLNIRVAVKSGSWKWALQHSLKDSMKLEDHRNAVYQLTCADCPKTYIGETKRTIRTRVKEHCASARNNHPELSAIAEHALLCDHKVSWQAPKILCHEKGTVSRRVQEALWLAVTKDTVNRDQGLELSPLWLALMNDLQKKS